MKKLLIIIFLTTLFFLPNSSVQAQNTAECDACGYCVGRTAPGNWESCRTCMYPGASSNAASNETLILQRNASGKMIPVNKDTSTYFTQLGCLDIGEGSFTDPTAPGGLLNFLLTKLIFPIVGVLSFISLIYGAFLLMTAQDRPEQVGRGKSYIVGAIVGLVFTLSAILLINILASDILKIPGFSNGSVVKLYAAGQPSLVHPNKIVQPIVEIKFGNDIVGQATIQGADTIGQPLVYKDFTIATTRKLREGEIVTLRFINDHAPDCCGRQGGPEDDGDGDRNFYLRTAEIDNIPCQNFNYDGKTIISGSTVYANQSKIIICNF